jgi:RND family efflux transporter MFP subunit
MQPNNRTKAPLAAALTLLAAVVLAACGGAEGQENGEGEAVIPAVEAVQARFGALPLRERLTGTVRATGQVDIYPETSGLVTQVLAENGEAVAAGEPLVRINAQTSQAQLGQARASQAAAEARAAQARANLEGLEAQFERTQALARDSLVSQEEVETQRAQLEALRATLQQAEAEVAQSGAQISERQESLSQTVVRAPVSGRVGQRDVEVGMRVDGQTRLFTVGNLDRVRVEVPVTQEMLSRFAEGQTVELTIENVPDTVIVAEVSRISPFLAEGSFSAEAEIDVSNEGGLLRPGMFVTADVFYGESEQATLLPRSALYENPATGTMGVYVAPSLTSETLPAEIGEDGRAPLTRPTPTRFQPVEVRAEGSQLAGVDGVEPGAWVVVVGQHLLSDGAEGPAEARVRPISWERIVDLQRLQRQDLLRQFMEEQQRIARQRADSLANTTS